MGGKSPAISILRSSILVTEDLNICKVVNSLWNTYTWERLADLYCIHTVWLWSTLILNLLRLILITYWTVLSSAHHLSPLNLHHFMQIKSFNFTCGESLLITLRPCVAQIRSTLAVSKYTYYESCPYPSLLSVLSNLYLSLSPLSLPFYKRSLMQ